MTTAPVPSGRFDLLARVLHWLMVVLVVAALLLGVSMVRSPDKYETLLALHKSVGIGVLVLGVLRIANRLLRRGPGPLATLGPVERVFAVGSEILMYGLFLAQPVLGWVLASAAGMEVRVLDLVTLPALVDPNPELYTDLRDLHTVLAYVLLAVFTAHVCAIVFHALVLRDGLLDRMLFGRRRQGAEQASS